MSIDIDDEEEQLRKAIELSKQTYNEEQRQRHTPSPDLLLGDPDDIQRQRNMDEIAALFSSPQPLPPPPHYLQPGSNATLPYGFRPDFLAYKNTPRFMSPNTVIPFPKQSPYYISPHSASNSSSSSSFINQPRLSHSISYSGSPTITNPGNFSGSNLHIQPSTPILSLNTPIPLNVNHSPIIVPFRTQGGNLIDLDNAPAAIDEGNTSNVYTNEPTPVQELPELQFDELLALIEKYSESQAVEETPKYSASPIPPRKIEREVIVGKLELVDGKNDFAIQCQRLMNYAEQLKNRTDRNVFFIAPTVDYLTTAADSIKLIIYRDETWPTSFSNVPEHVEMTYEVSSTCEDLLISVLCRFLNPDDNDGTLPIDEYTLKIYGTDEFLEPNGIIGKHPIVGRFLARGKDVPLTIGRKQLRDVNFHNTERNEQKKIMDYEFPRIEVDALLIEINDCFSALDNSESHPKQLRDNLANKVTTLCRLCHKLQTYDIAYALEGIIAADVHSQYKSIKDNLVRALHTMLSMYIDATLSDCLMGPLTEAPDTIEIRESRAISDEFMIQVDSLHNLPTIWFQKYGRFYVEICMMYGTKRVGQTCRTQQTLPTNRHKIFTIQFSDWLQTNVQIMLLPREVQVCVMVFGVPKTIDSKENAHELLGFSSFPLFDCNGYLTQGKITVPLKSQQSPVIQPWGPKPLIRNKTEALLVLSTVEYQYKIEFPRVIEEEQFTASPFSSLSEQNQAYIWDLLDSNISHCNLTTDEQQLLWSNRKSLVSLPDAFVPTLASALSWDCLNLCNIYPLLTKWNPPEPQYILDLLLPNFQDTYVRKRAIELVSKGSSEFLISLLPQFIEALRFEVFEDSALAMFLLERSTKDRRFATILYWELNHRVINEMPPYSTRCHHLLNLLKSLEIPNFLEEISSQRHFLSLLDGVCHSAKNATTVSASGVAQSGLYDINDKIMITGLRLPINPGFLCTSISVEDCGVFNSLTRPLKLSLVGLRSNYGVIYKVGDDLRQDAIVLQLVRLMNDLWLRENLDLRMLTYRVQPTGKNKGLIELVNECKTLREIQTTNSDRATDVFKDNSISNWINRHNSAEFNNRTAFDNFTRSCAGWCVATYVLGIGDRHNDNILISKSGHAFHIDFGKYMGDWQTAMGINRDRVPFVLTPEMVFAINNGTKSPTERFQQFADYCCKAYNILRRNCGLLLNIIRFMSCSSIPYMNVNSVNFVENNLMLNSTEHEANTFFTGMIRTSVDSAFPRLNFLAHTMAQMMSGNAGSSSQDMDNGCFSFTTEIFTCKTDGRIKTVYVLNYEKWRIPTKVYMYHFQVHRQNEKLPTVVYRTFDEIQELHRALVRRFTEAALPVFDASVGFGRTNVRHVAQQRKLMLQNFFSRFFELANEITQCDLVYTFFHAIHRDTNPEVVKDIISHNHLNNEPPSIHLSLSVEKNSTKLKIFISHARNLPLIGGVTTTPPDSYVKIYLNPDKRMASKRKSDVIRSTCNPTYNSHIEYDFDSIEEMRITNLDVSIWNSSASIVRDNFPLCRTVVRIQKLFKNLSDRRGTRAWSDWFILSSLL